MVDTELEPSPPREHRPGPQAKRRRRLLATSAGLVLVLAFAVGGMLWSKGVFWAPVRLSQVIDTSYTVAGRAPALPWPAQGESYLYVEGVGPIGSSGPQDAEVPIASVTKTMTAYQVLLDHPLAADEDGPTIEVSSALFGASRSADASESGIQIVQGELLTERQALESMLLPSAGNMARLLAAWDAGSVPAFVDRMNAQARALGMRHTSYADPAGIDALSRSTAGDQVTLGEQVLRNPAMAGIVDLKSARVPVAGLLTNTNHLLGVDGDIGIKTGSTSAAGGCLLFATRTMVGGVPVTMVGAVLGQPGQPWAIMDRAQVVARGLIEAAQRSLVASTVVHSGRTVAVLRQRGHADVELAPGSDVTVVGWPSLGYRVGVTADGVLRVSSTQAPESVVTAAKLAEN
ncbi:D-alanyl-D-alanine carboxypeptidase [Actinospica durhamensis]|uniref:D-alanyl-D-alanine carboxypeptidase n=1 Tax=Actinospica durhamensis TaxID=1508375 RepID=A0A941IUG4_9ACTN|nr:D-alanyl-D-alanine carboxypeptidase [Actinospica durhamensis]MBR7835511.1 D-alanyl-D-alanine carboxypeptidase [Actinospica durhamensis]